MRTDIQAGLLYLISRIAEDHGVSPDAGWDWVVQEPTLASFLPLIHYAIPQDLLPLSESARARCAQAYYHTASRNVLIYHELSRAAASLYGDQAAGSHVTASLTSPFPPIPTVVLKGAALALTLYPSIGLRPMSDVDILVPEEHLTEAVSRLEALGYVKPFPEPTPGLNRFVGHHVGLQGGGITPLYLEIHWTLVAGEHEHHAPSMDWFWSHTEPLSQRQGTRVLSGMREPASTCLDAETSLLTLDPTAHLLYLAAHLMLQHGEARSQYLWFYDIDLLLRLEGSRIAWDELLRQAREFHWEAAVEAALQGVRERFGTPLPEGVLDALTEQRDQRSATLVERKASPLQTRAIGVWNRCSSLDGRARLKLIVALVFPSRSYVYWRYKPRPKWLWPLWYPYRWLDILCEGLSTGFKLMRQSDHSEKDKAGTRSSLKKRLSNDLTVFGVWLLASLLAIAYIGDHPYLGLGIASVGGIVLGVVAFLSYERDQDQDGEEQQGG